MSTDKRHDRISRWLVQLKERVGWQKAVVAMANKNARILRAVLTRGIGFDPDHMPEILRRAAVHDRRWPADGSSSSRILTNSSPGRALEDALHRSHRRQVSSITLSCLEHGE